MNTLDHGQVVWIEKPWVKTFAWIPRKTIGGRWIWFQTLYSRRAWVYTGFVDEPETQYADVFELLKHNETT